MKTASFTETMTAVRASAVRLAGRRAHRAPPSARPTPPAHPRGMAPDAELARRLSILHDHYVGQVNRAVAEDREDLTGGLSDSYADEALLLMAANTR